MSGRQPPQGIQYQHALPRVEIESNYLGTVHVLGSALDDVGQAISNSGHVHHMLDRCDCDMLITVTVTPHPRGSLVREGG